MFGPSNLMVELKVRLPSPLKHCGRDCISCLNMDCRTLNCSELSHLPYFICSDLPQISSNKNKETKNPFYLSLMSSTPPGM